MRKLLLIAALLVALIFPTAGRAAELLNVTSAGVDGNLVFYDVSGNIIMTLDSANRKLSFPVGSVLETLGTSITLRNVAYTLPAADGAASTYLMTNGSKVLSWAAPTATVAWNAIGDAAAAGTVAMTTYAQTLTSTKTDGDMFLIQGLGAFGDVSVLRVEQKTGLATDGTVLEVISADTDVDALLVTANLINSIIVAGSGAVSITGGIGVIDYTDFDVDADGKVTIASDDGGTMLTFSPSAAAVAIDASNATITTALSVGANDIIGTTGLINYTNFDVDASGNIVSTGNLTAVDGTFSGNVNVTGTFLQNALRAATAAATTITLDGTTTGGVTIGGISTGTITLGAAGSAAATLVNLPATVDMTISGGDFAVTDTAEADTVTFTNNTSVTNDLLTLSAAGTRTSNNVIAITDGATTASTIGITANTQTSGHGISYTNTGAALTGAALYMAVTDGAGFTGYYIHAYDGAATDFSVRQYGATVIAGNAKGTDALTLNAGDILVTSGHIDMTTGNLTVAEGTIDATVTTDIAHSINRNFAGAGSAAALTVAEQNANSTSTALAVTNAGTGAATGVSITHTGDLSALAITAGAARTGNVIDINMDNQLAEKVLAIDAGAWTGTINEGAIEFTSDVAATAEAGQAIRVNLQATGTSATAITGKALYAHTNAAVKAGESLVYLDSLFNTALHIKNDGAAADGILIEAKDAYTGRGIIGDLGAWTGTVDQGFIDLASDVAATAVVGQMIRARQLGTAQHATAIGGTVLYMEDDATAPAAGTSYVMKIDATNIEAIHVDTGKVLVDETVTATGGLSSGTAADSFIYTDTVELSNVNIKALRATPIVLVAAPGADKFIELVSAVLILDYGTNVLTESADNLVIEYNTSGTDITGAIEATGFIDAAADTIKTAYPTITDVSAANAVNLAIQLFNTGDGEYAGNVGADTTMTVKVNYRIHKAGL